MTSTEAILLKLEIRDRIVANGMPLDVKKGRAVDIAKWVSDLVGKIIEDRSMVK
mgnify:CR=1 FL=1